MISLPNQYQSKIQTYNIIFFCNIHLNSAVEEAAVLAWFIEQALGEGKRQHAPRLVGLPKTTRLLEELCPCHRVRACPWCVRERERERERER